MACFATIDFIKNNTFLADRQKEVWMISLINKKSAIIKDSGQLLPGDVR